MRSHDEHLAWCKERAREYLKMGYHANAVASMLSDLTKHPDWQKGVLIDTMLMLYMASPDIKTARRIIEGFR